MLIHPRASLCLAPPEDSLMSFEVTKALVKEMLDEDTSLQTIANQFSLDEIWDMLEDKNQIANDDQLFEALMDVMYATRPQGTL